MTTFQKEDIDLAIKYSINPIGMAGILRVYESLQRFVGMTSQDIDNIIVEDAFHHSYTKPPKYTYSDLPYELSNMVKGIILKSTNVENFLNEDGSKHKFILAFIKKRYQPYNFLFRGILTFNHLMRGEYTDNTKGYVTSVDYEMEDAS